MMKRTLSFLLCLVMVLRFAAPVVQAADTDDIYVSGGNLNNIVVGDNVHFENVVVDGDKVNTIRPGGAFTEAVKPVTNPEIILPQVEVPDVSCKCEECATLSEHKENCSVKAEYQKISSGSTKELFAQWGQYTFEEQAYMLDYILRSYPGKYEDLMKLLDAPRGSDSKTHTDGTTVSLDGIPEDGSMVVKDAADEAKDIVDAYIAKQEENSTPLFSYDVSVQDGEGAEWQPETSVRMELEMPGVKLHKNTKVYVVHVDDNGVATTIEAEVTEDGKVAFETPGFSAFFGFTVDFEYDGVMYSIPGMSSVKLSEIFDQLGMPLNAADVVDVEFTDYDLLSVEKLDGDWKLTSLQAFQTTETLTLTMNDGNVYEITVTDDVTSPATFKVGSSTGDSNGNGIATWNLYWVDQYNATNSGSDYTPGLNSNHDAMDGCSNDDNDLYSGSQAITVSGGGNFELCLQGCKDGVTDTYYLWIHSITVEDGSTLNIRLGSYFDPGETIVIYGNDDYAVPMLTVDNGSLYFNVGADDASLLPQNVGFTASHENASSVKVVLDNKNRGTAVADPIVYVENGKEGDGAENLVMNNVTFKRGDYRGIRLHPNKMQRFQLRNCTFESTVKSAYGGGAVYIDAKTDSTGYEVNVHNLYFYNVAFSSNVAGGGDGGAMTVYGNLDNTLFQGCTFDSNTATGKGGAVNIGNGTNTFGQGNIEFNNCSFSSTQSSTTYGGAIAIRDKVGAVKFDTCTFESIAATSHGGAISISNGDNAIEVTSVTVQGCTFTTTEAGSRGGAIRMITSGSPTLAIDDTTFYKCTAGSHGGAISLQGTIGNITIGSEDATIETKFENCTAQNRGGAVGVSCEEVGNITLQNADFNSNTAGSLGGALQVGIAGSTDNPVTAPIVAGAMTVTGCTFDTNKANGGVGGALSYCDGTYDSITVTNSSFKNCYSANFGGAIGAKLATEGDTVFVFSVTGAVNIWDCSFENCGAGGLSPTTINGSSTWDHDKDSSTAEVTALNGTGGGGAICLGGSIGGAISIKSTKADAATNTASYSQFKDCYTWNNGGAICFLDSLVNHDVDLQYLDFYGCRGRDGGNAIHISGARETGAINDLLVDHCWFRNCTYFTSDYVVDIPGGYDKTAAYAGIDNSGTFRTVGPTTCAAVIQYCDFEDNTSYDNGGGIYWNANNIKTGANNVEVIPSLSVQHCTFDGNHADRYGGGMFVESKVTVVDCDFMYNTSGMYGGAIAQTVYSNTLRMLGETEGESTNLILDKDTNIYSNTSANGGGISLTIKNTVSVDDDNPVVYPVKFQLNGAKVYNNHATENGGGVYYYTASYPGEDETNQKLQREMDYFQKEVILDSGAIYGNTAGYNADSTTDNMGNGGGVYMESTQVDNSDTCEGYSKVSISNGSIYSNTANKGNGGGIYLTGVNALCTVTGGTIGGSSDNANTATAYLSDEQDATGAYIYKEGNGGGIAIYGGARIEMTGGTITYNTANVGGGIAVRDGSSMLSDMAKDGTVATISNNSASTAGGGIAVADMSTMTVNGGTVTYNTADNGGGIAVIASGDASTIGTTSENWGMIFNGGTISNNIAGGYGGGVMLSANATMKLTGGDITLNHAGTKTEEVDENGNPIFDYSDDQEGGGIAICQGSQVDMYGGTVDYNNAQDGGGVAIRGGSTLNMYPTTTTDATTGEEVETVGVIDNNTAVYYGGGIYCRSSDLNMRGGAISANKAYHGGGLYGRNDTNETVTAYIYGGSITTNTASGSGGGIFMLYSGTKMYMYGGTIGENTAGSDGGGVYIDHGAYAEISKYTNTETGEVTYPYVTKNTGSSGGGIHVRYGAELLVDEGFITYNTAKGTGVKVDGTQLETAKGAISTGSNAGIGGGIYLGSFGSDETYRAKFTLTGTNVGIYGNIAEFAADDVFANGTLTTLDVPGVALMNLGGYGYTPEGWFEDYAKNDTAYTQGLNLAAVTAGKTDITDGNVWRYRSAEAGKRVLIDDANVAAKVNVADTYVCMTLGHAAAMGDTVVIDYGLPVKIDVVANDITIADQDFVNTGLLGAEWPSDVTNVNKSDDDIFFGELSKEHSYSKSELTLTYGKAYLSDGYVVYQLDTTAMDMIAEDTFYYAVNPGQYYHYAKVTVIPATTLYYEDNVGAITHTGDWETEGDPITDAMQDEDRPGEDKDNALGDVDADNVYGYDSHYANMSTYSMDSAMMANVSAGNPATAKFSFWGTGFDVVSLTSANTGLIVVKVTDANNAPVVNYMVDTYYGYVFADTDNDGTADSWIVDTTATNNAIYQVPVIKLDLTKAIEVAADDTSTPDTVETELKVFGYGYYNVEIVASYSSVFDHGQCDCETACEGCYDFYLDAIRIYNPAKDWETNETIKDAYVADDEGWPSYQEIRNLLISKDTFNSAGSTDINGAIFIDGYTELDADTNTGETADGEHLAGKPVYITDYANFGPNNEVYLAAEQGIAFALDTGAATLPDGVKIASVQIGLKSTAGSAAVKIYDAEETTCSAAESMTLSSATDMYYEITSMDGGNVVIYCESASACVSITNLKITYTGNPVASGSGETGGDSGEEIPAGNQIMVMNADVAESVLNSCAEEVSVPVLTPKYPSLYLKGEVHYNVYFTAENLGTLGADRLGLVTFNTEAVDGTVETASDVITGAEAVDGMYMVSTNGIPAKNLGDTLYFKVFAQLDDGSYVYSDLYNYSARQYADNVLANSTDAELKTLVVALLNYGAAAQEFFGYNTDNLINKDVTAEQQAWLAEYSAASLAEPGTVDETKQGAFTANGGFAQKYPSVSTEGAFRINYYFVPEYEVDGTMTFYYWNEDTYNSASELTADNADGMAALTATDGSYTASSPQIAAKDMEQTIYIAAVYESNGTTYCTGVLPYSLAAYCKNNTVDTTSDLYAIANATAVYGCAAKEFFSE